eukprot:Sspe_Gene.109202::Locus_88743_Transcript_1_3_Confidence_0.500_Length_1951::g.109202::m.109202
MPSVSLLRPHHPARVCGRSLASLLQSYALSEACWVLCPPPLHTPHPSGAAVWHGPLLWDEGMDPAALPTDFRNEVEPGGEVPDVAVVRVKCNCTAFDFSVRLSSSERPVWCRCRQCRR